MKNALIIVLSLFTLGFLKPVDGYSQQFPKGQYIIKEANPPAKIQAAYEAWRLTELGMAIETSTSSGCEEVPEFLGFYQITEISFAQNNDQYYAVYRHCNNSLSAVKISGNGQAFYVHWMNFMSLNTFLSYLD